MEIQKIETLLLQEMEDVKGGASGTCICEKGAGQGTSSDGSCQCTKGGAGQLLNDSGKVDPPTCMCGTVGGAGQ